MTVVEDQSIGRKPAVEMTGASLIRRHLVGAQSSRCAQSPRTYSVISTGTREACVVERSILASPGISPLRGYATTVEMTAEGGAEMTVGGVRNDCGRGRPK